MFSEYIVVCNFVYVWWVGPDRIVSICEQLELVWAKSDRCLLHKWARVCDGYGIWMHQFAFPVGLPSFWECVAASFGHPTNELNFSRMGSGSFFSPCVMGQSWLCWNEIGVEVVCRTRFNLQLNIDIKKRRKMIRDNNFHDGFPVHRIK